MSVVLDTTVVIDVLRGHPAALDYVLGLDSVPACSELTRVEVLRGLRSEERGPAERLFQEVLAKMDPIAAPVVEEEPDGSGKPKAAKPKSKAKKA